MPKVDDRIGPYQLIKKIGKGGFGEVWLAKNVTALVSRNPQVALKIPHDEDVDLDAIKQEAAIWLAATGHDNVLPFIEANVYGDQVVIVSEYAPDGSLHGWLKPHGGRAPSTEMAIELIGGILNGLAHLHARNIIHRDLKPDNILLQGTTPRITDFGISRIFKTTTKRTQVVGTPVYMAPEAFDGERNQQTDVWSVGVMLYQLLAGRLPFKGETYEEVKNVVLAKPPHPMPESVPLWLQRVVTKAIEKKPEARYKTAKEMLSALQPPVANTPTTVPKSKHPQPQRVAVSPKLKKSSRRVWVGSIGTGLAFISIWAGVSRMTRDTGTAEPTPTATVAPSSTVTPKPKPTATASALPKPSVTPVPKVTPTATLIPKPTAMPTPSPKIKPSPLLTPPVIEPKQRPVPVERAVPRVVVPDKPKPLPAKPKPDDIFKRKPKPDDIFRKEKKVSF